MDETTGSIIAPYTTRTTRTTRLIRSAMTMSAEPTEQVQNILPVVRDVGLQPYTPPSARRYQ